MVGHYFFSKTYVAGQSKATQERTPLRLSSGVVHDVVIDFPRGCIYTTHVKIMRGEFQVFPRNVGAYYAYDGYTIKVGDYWVLPPLAASLTLVGYNLDTLKPHTIRVALQVSEPERYFSERGLLDKMDEFIEGQKTLFGIPEFAQQDGED